MFGLSILRLGALGALVMAGALAPSALLAAERTPAELAAWVTANTDIAPAQIAIVTPEYVYGFEPLGPVTATGEALALVRTEAFAGTAGAVRGVQSWEAHLLFDCRGSRVRLIRSADYRERNRGGAPTATEETAPWLSPSADEPASKLLAAACDPTYAWPLRANTTRLAMARSTPIPPALPAPASIPTTPPPESAPAAPAFGAYAIQVARGPSAEGARAALRHARKALGATGVGLPATTEHSKLGVRDRFTAVLSGFPTEAEAGVACATLRAAGRDCFVRGAPAAAPAPFEGYAVQLAFGPSKDGSALAVRRARKALGPLAAGLKDASESSADGARYTALLSGFETAGAAARACEVLQREKLTCFARPALLPPVELAAR